MKISRKNMFKINEFIILPRNDDLPSHYVSEKKSNKLSLSRMNIILAANEIFNHNHQNCKDKRIIYNVRQYKKNSQRFHIDIYYKSARFIIEKYTIKLVLVTALKLDKRKIFNHKKSCSYENLVYKFSDINFKISKK